LKEEVTSAKPARTERTHEGYKELRRTPTTKTAAVELKHVFELGHLSELSASGRGCRPGEGTTDGVDEALSK